MKEYYEYTYTGQKITLYDFFDHPYSILYLSDWGIVDFLLYVPTSDGMSKSNAQIIYEQYERSLTFNSAEKDFQKIKKWKDKLRNINKSSKDEDFNDLVLLPNTTLYILFSVTNGYNGITNSENQVIIKSNSLDLYLNEELDELINNPKYKVTKSKETTGPVTLFNPNFKVYAWSRTLSSSAGRDIVINLSSFIGRINMTSSMQNSSFGFDLAPMPGYYDFKKGWVIDEKLVRFWFDQFKELNYDAKINLDYIEETIESESGMIKTYFDKILSKNDIVFIAFEKLDLEDKIEKEEYFINKETLANNSFDMIGTINEVSKSTNFTSNDMTINISGNDLTKFMNDDTFYMFPDMYKANGLFYNGKDKAGLIRWGNKLHQNITDNFKALPTYVQFVFNALSTIEIGSNELFTSWGDKRTTYLKLPSGLNNDGEYGPGKLTKGVYQIIKISIDEQIKHRALIDTSLGNTTATGWSNIMKIVQEPFVQVLPDTYHNQFYLTIRQCPWNEKAFKNLCKIADDKFTINPEDVISFNVNWNTDETFSWYRLTPKGMMTSQDDSYSLAFLKAVRFPEYANIFGEKACEITSPYFKLKGTEDGRTIEDTNEILKQVILDLQLLVQSYQYMPFTRKGNIVIKGDRRYKKGTVVFNKLSQEYFYVDSVTQNAVNDSQTDRTTTLSLSRGMVKRDLSKYFNLIISDIDDLEKITRENFTEIVKRNVGAWRVNTFLFDYFLKKRQYSKEGLKTSAEAYDLSIDNVQVDGVDAVQTGDRWKSGGFDIDDLADIINN